MTARRTTIRQLPLTEVVDRDTPGATPVSITTPRPGRDSSIREASDICDYPQREIRRSDSQGAVCSTKPRPFRCT